MNDKDEKDLKPTVIVRDFDAPKQLVFETWTQPQHLKNWQFPFLGFTVEFLHADIKPGGYSLHKMTSPDGFEMWLLTRYEDIAAPSRIVFRQYNSNASGEILPNPRMPNWPKELRTIVDLEDIGSGTRVVLTWQPVDPSTQEIETFEATRPEHEKGWGSGLEQLKTYLESLKISGQ